MNYVVLDARIGCVRQLKSDIVNICNNIALNQPIVVITSSGIIANKHTVPSQVVEVVVLDGDIGGAGFPGRDTISDAVTVGCEVSHVEPLNRNIRDSIGDEESTAIGTDTVDDWRVRAGPGRRIAGVADNRQRLVHGNVSGVCSRCDMDRISTSRGDNRRLNGRVGTTGTCWVNVQVSRQP